MVDPVWVDGTTPLNSANLTKLQTRDEKAAASGYASLDSGGKVPLAQLPLATNVSYGTALPASPVDGQEAVLVDSVTAPTYQWRFRYNAGSTSAYKWEFVGGGHLLRGPQGSINTASTSWQPVSGGPTITVPRAGDYIVEFGARLQSWVAPTADLQLTTSWSVSGLGSIIAIFTPVGQYNSATIMSQEKKTVTAGEVVNLAVQVTTSQQVSASLAWVKVTPIRVS